MWCGSFDARGDTLEMNWQVGEVDIADAIFDQSANPLVGMQISAVSGQCAELAKYRSAEHTAIGESRPGVDHALDGRQGGICGNENAVEGSDARSDDHVGNYFSLEKGAQHPHLCCPKKATAAEDEGGEWIGWHLPRMTQWNWSWGGRNVGA